MSRRPSIAARSLLALSLFSAACGIEKEPVVPSRELALRHVVLYQNGVGYFERTGALQGDRLRLQFRSGELEDVLKTLVVVEGGASDPTKKPSTVTVLLPQAPAEGTALREGDDGATALDIVLSPRPSKELSIAYAVPTAAWKSAYRVILPDAGEEKKGVLLQAWALIDNVSDEDWRGIKLTLATGAPLTFNTDFRAVRVGKRPNVGGFSGEPGPLGPVQAEQVASVDRDADGIPDAQDACPMEPGMVDPSASKSGCPRYNRVIVSSSEIRILETVAFDANADAVKPISFPILDQVVAILNSHPEIRSLSLEGHTASGERDPWGLAARRAGAVRAYLVNHGVRTELQVATFGDTRPIADNKTEEGRSRNRRVSFSIADRKDQAESAPTTTPGSFSASNLAKTGQSSAILRDVAGVIRYDITHPVSIPGKSSTLVTIINEYIPGEEIYLYRPDPNMPGSDKYPMRAARLDNKSGFGLQPGPVAIYGGGTFVGEGLLGKLQPGDTALIPYGIDSATAVRPEVEEARQPVRLVSLAKGVMTVEDARVVTTRYTIDVGMQAPARIFVRHARGYGLTAGALPPGAETTPEAYLIPLPIAPKKTSVLTVEERAPARMDLSILATDATKLGEYLKGGGIEAEQEKQLREAVSKRALIGRLMLEIEGLQTQLADIASRSQELREDLKAIERTPRASAVQQKLLDRLAAASKQAEDLSTKLASKSADLAEARAALAEALRDLRIEEKKK